MSTKLSAEAARLKYEYNKKYQQRYWEKKAAERRVNIQESTDEDTITITISVPRKGLTVEQYIERLETSNKTLNNENRRLVKLLQNYYGMNLNLDL